MGRAAEFVRRLPTLFVAIDWAEEHCVIPDGFDRVPPWQFADWQFDCLRNFYRVRPRAKMGLLAPHSIDARRSWAPEVRQGAVHGGSHLHRSCRAGAVRVG